MWIFIDESGDAGFKLVKGSSQHFIVSMVIFKTEEATSSTTRTIKDLAEKLNIKPEFKFAKSCNNIRDGFFEGISNCDFTTRSVVVDKSKIYSSHLKENKESFYNFFIRTMLKYDNGRLNKAKIIIDGSGDRAFKNEFKAYIRRSIPDQCVKKLSLKDSRSDPLIQLADMVAGAIARSYKRDKADCSRWRKILKDNCQIDNIWDFQ
ncbi:DUF3800 domain-containing protein [Acetobacter fabarum]|uniref:DUF3800 domain-containing protein n=1 Tax=Acetobacter fabarum TaxID=483199 RepID=UPI0039EBC4A7